MFHSTFDSAGPDWHEGGVRIVRKELKTTCERWFFVSSEVDV